tara:strand:- start:1519 stop:3339 length:1821 start_codon:yes stop_codon:yes gene_type:complete
MTKVKEPESYIRLLPDAIIDKIAAGEVIQRPASVVKELLDNSIDAGADRIELVIEQSGRTLIQVTDNGCGMSEVDLERCFTRHATSKIQALDDLFAIRTMGFRGEAMSSISAISQVEAKSKLHDHDAGWVLRLHGGEIQQKSPVATKNGTQIIVRNLFFNVPARRQFLKTDATEFRHILKTVQHAAISHPEIIFTFISDADTVYQLPSQSLNERIVGMFGKRYKASLIPFSEQTSYVSVHGIAGDPKLSKKSRGEQFLFVNGRPFQHRYLMHVLLSLYDNWTHANEYPFFILFIDIEPDKIDLNVHPAKSEIKFEDERSVIQTSLSVMKRALNEHLNVPIIPNSSALEYAGMSPKKNQAIVDEQHPFRVKAKGLNFLKASNQANKLAGQSGELASQLYANQHWEQRIQTTLIEGDRDRFTNGFYWQLHASYIVTQTRTGLCLIDQYYAHKRILFEKTLKAADLALPSTQQLLFSQQIDLSASDYTLLKEIHPLIQKIGFSVSLLSGYSILIDGVPSDINKGDEVGMITDLLQSYRELDKVVSFNARERLALAFATRAAIQKGHNLEQEQMEALVDELFACDEPYYDPLKNPTILYMSLSEIQQRFR